MYLRAIPERKADFSCDSLLVNSPLNNLSNLTFSLFTMGIPPF